MPTPHHITCAVIWCISGSQEYRAAPAVCAKPGVGMVGNMFVNYICSMGPACNSQMATKKGNLYWNCAHYYYDSFSHFSMYCRMDCHKVLLTA